VIIINNQQRVQTIKDIRERKPSKSGLAVADHWSREVLERLKKERDASKGGDPDKTR